MNPLPVSGPIVANGLGWSGDPDPRLAMPWRWRQLDYSEILSCLRRLRLRKCPVIDGKYPGSAFRPAEPVVIP